MPSTLMNFHRELHLHYGTVAPRKAPSGEEVRDEWQELSLVRKTKTRSRLAELMSSGIFIM